MKTTVELSDATLRHAKAIAANRGITLRQLFTTALEEQIRRYTQETQARGSEVPWMAGFGALSDLSGENRRILELIEEEFEVLDLENAT